MRFPWFPLLQSINASCNYKNKTCNYKNEAFIYIIKSCNYSLLYSLNKFPSYAKEVCIGRKELFYTYLRGKIKRSELFSPDLPV